MPLSRAKHLSRIFLATTAAAASLAPDMAFAACDPTSRSLWKSAYVNGGILLRDGELRDVDLYNLSIGAKHTAWCVSQDWEASLAGKVYYSQREVRLESARIRSQVMGFGLARMSYDNWTQTDGFTPYGVLNLEKSNIKRSNDEGTQTRDHSSVFVWGIGIEQTLGPEDSITLDLSRRFKFDKIASDRLSDEIVLTLKFNLLRLL